ncbi:hypothetical protein WMO79_08215 [Micrococcaceae bacterium Sec7.4]
MTEQKHITETDPDGGEAQVSWPVPAAEPGEADGHVPSTDPEVAALLERLNELPGLPVALHGDVYAGLHDELLAALNETGTTTSPRDATHEQA